jgi:hypothetical protein
MTMTQDEIRQHVSPLTQNPNVLTADADPSEEKAGVNIPTWHVVLGPFAQVGDRPVVLVRRLWAGEIYNHGEFFGPVGLSSAEALKRVDAVFETVVAADPDEWTYHDVRDALEEDGFIEIRPAVWWAAHN